MNLNERISQDMVKAVKTGDRTKTSVLRLLKSQLKNKEIEKGDPLSDQEVFQTLNSAVKQRRESMQLYKEGGRTDLFDKESKEVEILLEYLPEQLAGVELAEAISRAIKKVNASSPKDMGIVMKTIMSEYGGRVDGREVQRLVKEELS